MRANWKPQDIARGRLRNPMLRLAFAPGGAMKPDFAERIEFGSPDWVAAAREYLTGAVADAGARTDGLTFSICESFDGAPTHLKLPDDTAAWNAHFEKGHVTVHSGVDDTTLFRIRGSYHAVLPIA